MTHYRDTFVTPGASLTSECGHRNKDGDDDSKLPVHNLGKPHGDCLGAQHLGDTERGVEGDVGEGVDHRDQDDGDADGAGQVPHGVLQLLDHEVEIIPAVVGKQPRVEGQGYLGEISLSLVPSKV